jgi:alkylation response protein AidB-like acyl-CoA dehydrogenase
MRFEPNEDQKAFLAVIEQLAEGKEAAWKISPEWERFDWSAELDRAMEANGFFDAAAEPTLGLTAAAAMIFRIANLPIAAECAASATLRPRFAPDLPRPLAVLDGGARHAIRFLPVARSVIMIGADDVRAAIVEPGAVEAVESLFAYPMGVLDIDALDWKPVAAEPKAVRDVWRVALAAEIAGVLKGGLNAVVAHVRERQQFGRPLGSFQTIQHRLASAAAKIEAAYWLTLKAAQSLDPADAVTALGYVQEASTKIVYDLHQFMGAMGLTLEHPLHRWTYRARLLRSALGGASENLQAITQERWRAA